MNTPSPESVLADLQRSVVTVRRWTFGAILVGGVIVVAGIWFAVNAYQDTRNLNDAACAQRETLQTTADRTRDYRNKIQRGELKPLPGVTIAQLTQTIVSYQATLDSLRFLDCDPRS